MQRKKKKKGKVEEDNSFEWLPTNFIQHNTTRVKKGGLDVQVGYKEDSQGNKKER